jgi:hypothetical protein
MVMQLTTQVEILDFTNNVHNHRLFSKDQLHLSMMKVMWCQS